MKRKLIASSGDLLQNLGLLTAFVLLISASEFAVAHPALMSVLVFIFSLPYLIAAVVSRRASFLYATMLLGAVSYFFGCHALGAPGTSFPLLSVPLVVALLIVGHCLRKRLGAELERFPTTVFNAMNITVAVFAVWALLQVGGLMGEPGHMRYVAGMAYLGFAGLYFVHCVLGVSAVFTYVFAMFLTLGGIFTVAAAATLDVCWMPAIAAAAMVLAVGTRCKGNRGFRWSRHFYMASGGVIFVSLVLTLVRPSFLLVDLALASLLLWATYEWIAGGVPDLPRAMLGERVVAKCFFFCAVLLSAVVAPLVLVWPTDPYLVCAAVICGVTFLGITWARRDQIIGARGMYVFAAALFASAGVLGAGRQLPGWFAQGWSVIGPVALLGALGLAYAPLQKAQSLVFARCSALAAIFPVFFAWYIPVSQGEYVVGMVASVVAVGGVVALAIWLKERDYLYAVGPGAAGLFVAGTLLLCGGGLAAWVACAAAAAAAGACFLWADALSKYVIRGAANQAWLILSIAAVIVAGYTGTVQSLWGVTTVGSTSVLMSGLRRRRGEQG